jgi:hypothetical protein
VLLSFVFLFIAMTDENRGLASADEETKKE